MMSRSVYAESVSPTPHLQPSPRGVGVKTPDTMQKLSERMLKLRDGNISEETLPTRGCKANNNGCLQAGRSRR